LLMDWDEMSNLYRGLWKFNTLRGRICYVCSSPCQRQCELLPSLGVCRRSSVNFSHFILLLWNRWAKWTEIW
jgi:hypothetical protein